MASTLKKFLTSAAVIAGAYSSQPAIAQQANPQTEVTQPRVAISEILDREQKDLALPATSQTGAKQVAPRTVTESTSIANGITETTIRVETLTVDESPGSAGELSAATTFEKELLDMFPEYIKGTGSYTNNPARITFAKNGKTATAITPLAGRVTYEHQPHYRIFQTGKDVKENSYIISKPGEALRVKGSNADATTQRLSALCSNLQLLDAECAAAAESTITLGIDGDEWRAAALKPNSSIQTTAEQKAQLKTAKRVEVSYYVPKQSVHVLPETNEAKRTKGQSDVVLDPSLTQICRKVVFDGAEVMSNPQDYLGIGVTCEQVPVDKYIRAEGGSEVAGGHINHQPHSAVYLPKETVLRSMFRVAATEKPAKFIEITRKINARKEKNSNRPIELVHQERYPVYEGKGAQKSALLVGRDPEQKPWRAESPSQINKKDNAVTLYVDPTTNPVGSRLIVPVSLIDDQGLITKVYVPYIVQKPGKENESLVQGSSKGNRFFQVMPLYGLTFGNNPEKIHQFGLGVDYKFADHLGLGLMGRFGTATHKDSQVESQAVPLQVTTNQGTRVRIDDSDRATRADVTRNTKTNALNWAAAVRMPIYVDNQGIFSIIPHAGYSQRSLDELMSGKQCDFNAVGTQLSCNQLDIKEHSRKRQAGMYGLGLGLSSKYIGLEFGVEGEYGKIGGHEITGYGGLVIRLEK